MLGPTDEELMRFSIDYNTLQRIKPALNEILKNYQEIPYRQNSPCIMMPGQNNLHSSIHYKCQGSHIFCKSCLQSFFESRFIQCEAKVDYYCPYCDELICKPELKQVFLYTLYSAFQKEAIFTDIPLMNIESVEVIQLFKDSTINKEVVKVERVKNVYLDSRFENVKQILSRKGCIGIEKVWHGTDTELKYRSICQEGFLIGGENIGFNNGNYFGNGVNTCINASSCIVYTRNTRCLLLCEGILEEDSDARRCANVLVFRNPSQVIPRYLVRFK